MPQFLTIDHINGDGWQHRQIEGIQPGTQLYRWLKRNGFPKDRFQLLCFNCNCAKSIYGVCPHKEPGASSAALGVFDASLPDKIQEQRQTHA